MPSDVFFYEAFEEETEALRRFLPAHIRAGFTPMTPREAGDTVPPASLLSTRTQSLLPPAWGDRVAGILSRSTGFDHLVRYREASGRPDLPCGYLPLYCHRAVAEQALLLWMGLLRRLPRQLTQFASFERDGMTGAECQGKTLLVVGVGNIGSEVVAIGAALGMTVLCVDPVEKDPGLVYVDIEDGLPRADVIVCAMNLTDRNYHYFDAERLGVVKPGAMFVNVARGELACAAALLEAVRNGRLGGVGLDVYEDEAAMGAALRQGRAPEGSAAAAVLALQQHRNVICTPHNAFNTAGAVQRKSEQTVQQVRAFLADGTFIWAVP